MRLCGWGQVSNCALLSVRSSGDPLPGAKTQCRGDQQGEHLNRLEHEKVYKAQLIVYEEGKLQRVTQQNVYFRGIFSEFVCI